MTAWSEVWWPFLGLLLRCLVCVGCVVVAVYAASVMTVELVFGPQRLEVLSVAAFLLAASMAGGTAAFFWPSARYFLGGIICLLLGHRMLLAESVTIDGDCEPIGFVCGRCWQNP